MPVGIFSTRHNQTLKPWPEWPFNVPSDLAFCCFHLGCFRKSAMDIPKRLWKSDSERYCSLRAGSTSAGLPGQR